MNFEEIRVFFRWLYKQLRLSDLLNKSITNHNVLHLKTKILNQHFLRILCVRHIVVEL